MVKGCPVLREDIDLMVRFRDIFCCDCLCAWRCTQISQGSSHHIRAVYDLVKRWIFTSLICVFCDHRTSAAWFSSAATSSQRSYQKILMSLI
jgi:hypothetical protein